MLLIAAWFNRWGLMYIYIYHTHTPGMVAGIMADLRKEAARLEEDRWMYE